MQGVDLGALYYVLQLINWPILTMHLEAELQYFTKSIEVSEFRKL